MNRVAGMKVIYVVYDEVTFLKRSEPHGCFQGEINLLTRDGVSRRDAEKACGRNTMSAHGCELTEEAFRRFGSGQ